MKAFGTKQFGLVAAALLMSAGLMTVTAAAQTDAPPPPPQGQQGPPQGGPGGRGGMDPERRVEQMQKRLKLSDDQTAQVKAVLLDGRSKMEALRSNTSLSRQDMRMQGEALRQQEETRLEAVLTPDQKKQYEEMREKQQERMRENRGGPNGAGGPPPSPPPPAQ